MSHHASSPRTFMGYTLADVALVGPFALWIAGIFVLFSNDAFDFPVYVYAVKTILCAGAVLLLRPWRFANCSANKGDILLGCLVGFAVYVLWAVPESTPWECVTTFYYRWFVMMPGSLPDYNGSLCYAFSAHPILAIVKLIGSAFVIAPIEEFFFRGWLMRWLTQHDWQSLALRNVSRQAFWTTVVVFAFEHDRFIGGALAGIAYGALAVKTNSLRASIIAHVITNFILGLHVLFFDAYHFW